MPQPQLASHPVTDSDASFSFSGSDSDDKSDASPLDEAFHAAADAVAAAVAASTANLKQDDKLQLYGLYKQAMEGPCTSGRPAFWDLKARSKWEAWHRLGQVPAEAARTAYVQMVMDLLHWMPPKDSADGGKASGSRAGGDLQRMHSEATSSGVRQLGSGFGPVVSTLAGSDGIEADKAAPSALHAAAAADDVAAAEAALASGADVNARDDEGATPLHWAADRGSLQVLSLLVRRGAELNAADADGQTPLHYAALCEQEAAARALLAAGATVSQLDTSSKSAADLAPSNWQRLWHDGG